MKDNQQSFVNSPQQLFSTFESQCPQCSIHLRRFIDHSNTTHFTDFLIENPNAVHDITTLLPTTNCFDCKCLILMLQMHLKTDHPPSQHTDTEENVKQHNILTIIKHLIDDSNWIDECFTCHNNLDHFVEHIQAEHRKLPTAVDEDRESSCLTYDHNYYDADVPSVEDEIEVSVDVGDAEQNGIEVVNEYLTNTPERVYFKVHSTETGTLYTCTHTTCYAVCRNQAEMMEHTQEHLTANVNEKLNTDVNTKLTTVYQNGRGINVPLDYQCDVCKEVQCARNRVINCLNLHNRYKPTTTTTPSKPVICHICETEQENAQKLQQHLSEQHGKSVRVITDNEIRVKLVIKCSICPQLEFDDIIKAVVHRKALHSLPSVPCLYGRRCVIKADRSETFVHQPTAEFATGCKLLYEFHCICGSNFKNCEEKAQHCLNRHTNIKKFTCPEAGCARQYFSAADLATHERRIHRKLKKQTETVVCDLCGRTIGKLGMKTHYLWHQKGGAVATKQKQRKRASVQPRTCPICKKSYSNMAQMRKHVRHVHQKVREFVCNVCDKRFTYHQAADLCEAKHQGDRSVACVYCDKMFYTRSQKLNHELQIHVKRQNLK